ncbi:WD repeat-containing protein 1 [Savitreella phatthalungensis]
MLSRRLFSTVRCLRNSGGKIGSAPASAGAPATTTTTTTTTTSTQTSTDASAGSNASSSPPAATPLADILKDWSEMQTRFLSGGGGRGGRRFSNNNYNNNNGGSNNNGGWGRSGGAGGSGGRVAEDFQVNGPLSETAAMMSELGLRPGELSRYETRLDRAGTVYGGEDLSFDARRPVAGKIRLGMMHDGFHECGISPLGEYKCATLLNEFVTDLGRIKQRADTGLRHKTQRKLAKAIRRAQAVGIMPSVGKYLPPKRTAVHAANTSAALFAAKLNGAGQPGTSSRRR